MLIITHIHNAKRIYEHELTYEEACRLAPWRREENRSFVTHRGEIYKLRLFGFVRFSHFEEVEKLAGDWDGVYWRTWDEGVLIKFLDNDNLLIGDVQVASEREVRASN